MINIEIETTRSKPLLNTDTLAVLLETSRGALTKQLQRHEFPEALRQDGRTRLWSYAQAEPLISDRVKGCLPAHILLDPHAPHEVAYLGPTISTEAVTFWFLIDGVHGVGYSHTSWGQAQPDELFIQSHWSHPDLHPDQRTTVYFVERSLRGPRITIEATHEGLVTFGGVVDWTPTIEELEALLQITLPVWPTGTDEPELMSQWHPGAAPVHREIHSRATTLLHHASNSGRVRRTSLGGAPELGELTSAKDYFALQDYLYGHSVRDAVIDITAADRFEAMEHKVEHCEVIVQGKPTQSIVDMLQLWAPDDDVARELVHQSGPQIAFAPTESRPMASDDSVKETVLGYVLARFLGVPRQLLIWGVDAEFSVQGSHRHIKAIYARRPGGRWWSVEIPQHW